MAKFTFCYVKFFPLAATSAVFIGVTVPYIVAVTRKNVLTFLPYVSHAAGFPPQSAIHSIFMTLGAIFGSITVAMRYVAVQHRRHRIEPRKIRILNRVAVGIGVFAYLSLVLASHFPLAFVTHEKYDWLYTVIIPNFFGSALMVTAFTLYILIQSYLTYALRKRSAINVSIHATLAMTVVITNWTTCLPFYAAMRAMIPNTINRETGEISLETQEYSFYYIISSLSCWGFTFFTLLFIVTFYRDMKRMQISISVSPKPVKLDTVQPPPHTFTSTDEITKM